MPHSTMHRPGREPGAGMDCLFTLIYALSPRYKKRSILPLKRVSCLVQMVQYSKIITKYLELYHATLYYGP